MACPNRRKTPEKNACRADPPPAANSAASPGTRSDADRGTATPPTPPSQPNTLHPSERATSFLRRFLLAPCFHYKPLDVATVVRPCPRANTRATCRSTPPQRRQRRCRRRCRRCRYRCCRRRRLPQYALPPSPPPGRLFPRHRAASRRSCARGGRCGRQRRPPRHPPRALARGLRLPPPPPLSPGVRFLIPGSSSDGAGGERSSRYVTNGIGAPHDVATAPLGRGSSGVARVERGDTSSTMKGSPPLHSSAGGAAAGAVPCRCPRARLVTRRWPAGLLQWCSLASTLAAAARSPRERWGC